MSTHTYWIKMTGRLGSFYKPPGFRSKYYFVLILSHLSFFPTFPSFPVKFFVLLHSTLFLKSWIVIRVFYMNLIWGIKFTLLQCKLIFCFRFNMLKFSVYVFYIITFIRPSVSTLFISSFDHYPFFNYFVIIIVYLIWLSFYYLIK